MNTKYWICWWWVRGGVEGSMRGTPWIRTVYLTRRAEDSELQAYDVENGWKVGRVHSMEVDMEPPPPK